MVEILVENKQKKNIVTFQTLIDLQKIAAQQTCQMHYYESLCKLEHNL